MRFDVEQYLTKLRGYQMKTLKDFLDQAREITGSDYKTAQRLAMTRSGISHARKSGSMDIANAVELAKILNINPVEVIAACDIAKKPENREFWQKWVAATVVGCAMLTGLSGSGSPFISNAYDAVESVNNYYYAQLLLILIIAALAIVTTLMAPINKEA